MSEWFRGVIILIVFTFVCLVGWALLLYLFTEMWRSLA